MWTNGTVNLCIVTVIICLKFDVYPCNRSSPLVLIDVRLGVVVVNKYLKVIGQF